jgi:hypothetical protein
LLIGLSVAATDLGARLTEQHRQTQVANQQTFLAEYLALWRLLDPLNLDATAPGWLAAVLRLIDLFRDQSAEIALDYYREFRRIEAPDAPELPPIEIERPTEIIRAERRVARGNRGVSRAPRDVISIDFRELDKAARTSLIVTGPVNIKVKTKRARPVDAAQRDALVESSGAAMRHVIEGSRQATLAVVREDPATTRYMRVTDGDPCYFCAMLASRGPVYLNRTTASFRAHDHCACTAEPVFAAGSEWPGRAREFQKLWNREIRGQYSGKDAIRAWRRLYERRQREAGREIAA